MKERNVLANERFDLLLQRANRRQILVGTLGLSAGALLAACGGDDDDDDDTSGDATESSTEESETEATEAETEAEETDTEAATEEETAAETESATEAETEAATETETAEATETTTEAASETEEPEAGASGFEFTDGRGETVTLDTVPQRIVAEIGSAAALWDFGVRPVGFYGRAVSADGSKDPLAGRMDLDAVTSIGTGSDDFDVEALLALEPDLIVTPMFREGEPWGISEDILPQVEQIAPIVSVRTFGVSVTSPLYDYEALAGALGADLESPEVTEAKTHFQDICDQVRTITDEKPGLAVLSISTREEEFYVGAPDVIDILLLYGELGVELVKPEIPEGQRWETLSWEQALKYPSDIVLNSFDTASLTNEQLIAIPTMAEHPAVKAGQVGYWPSLSLCSYQGLSEIIEELVSVLEASRADVV